MNPRNIEQAKDRNLPASMVALKRAAQRARELAARTGTSLVLAKRGRIERVTPAGADKG
jgi:hypothetical protein